jgi:hypothetical protein
MRKSDMDKAAKQLSADISTVKMELAKAKTNWMTDPEYVELKEKIDLVEKKARERNLPFVESVKARLDELCDRLDAENKRLRDEKRAKADLVPDVIKECFRKYTFGFENPNNYSIRWYSKDLRFVIIDVKGSTFWSGRGERAYGNSSHCLLSVCDFSNARKPRPLKEWEGRLPKGFMDEVYEIVGDKDPGVNVWT